MVKKVKVSKEDMKQVSGGKVNETPIGYFLPGENVPVDMIEVYDNVNGNLIRVFEEYELQEAYEFDKNYKHGNTPKRDVYDIFYEYWNG